MQFWYPGASFWHNFSGIDGYWEALGQLAGHLGVHMLILGDLLVVLGNLLGAVLESCL